jgi:hypothetical protein
VDFCMLQIKSKLDWISDLYENQWFFDLTNFSTYKRTAGMSSRKGLADRSKNARRIGAQSSISQARWIHATCWLIYNSQIPVITWLILKQPSPQRVDDWSQKKYSMAYTLAIT